MKRSLSPGPGALPPPKRQHTHIIPQRAAVVSLDTLSDEILLMLLAHLNQQELCVVQAASKNCARLALDNELWRALYLREFGRPRLRGRRGFLARTDGRETRPLPGRAKPRSDEPSHMDWKFMFRISRNWAKGRCAVDNFGDYTPKDQRHVVLAGQLVITADSIPVLEPEVHIAGPLHARCTLKCVSSRARELVHITALALDQASPTHPAYVQAAVTLSTGEFNIFLVNQTEIAKSTRTLTWSPSLRDTRRDHREDDESQEIVCAAYHHPLLVTLSKGFKLSLHDLSGNAVRRAQSLTSFTSFPPSSLVLSATATSYKLVIAYAIPVYPAHWSVGASEFIIGGSAAEEPFCILTSRTTRTSEVPQGWIDEDKMRAMQAQWGRKLARIADTQTDGKWIVLAPGDGPTSSLPLPSSLEAGSSSSTAFPISHSLHSPTGLQLYRLTLPVSKPSSTSTLPTPITAPPQPFPSASTMNINTPGLPMAKLTFVRTLHGQIGSVCALAVADGRCVSLGLNGGIWVWDLESGTGAEVAEPKRDVSGGGSIIFDERRIVTGGAGSVVVRRFDI